MLLCLLAAQTSPPHHLFPPLEVQAVEAAQFAKATKFVFLQNMGRRPATGLAFQVPTWGGGLVTSSKIVVGAFQ